MKHAKTPYAKSTLLMGKTEWKHCQVTKHISCGGPFGGLFVTKS